MKSKINSKTEYVSYWLVGGHDAHGKEHHDFSRFHFYYTKLTNIGEIQSGQIR